MKVHLIDGTYELFRAFYGAPSAKSTKDSEIGATRAFLRSLYRMLQEPDVTHVACAFDHTIESFRNDLFDGYKTGEGIDPALWNQFSWVERAAAALGVVVWPMVEFETDDALATGAARFKNSPDVEQVLICSPDKDFAQCVDESRVVFWDRLRNKTYDRDGVMAKWGIEPQSMPDYLALVGDTADGIPGIEKWGAKSSATVLAHYQHIENIPDDPADWAVNVRGQQRLAEILASQRAEATLYKKLATLRTDVPLREVLDDLDWRGAHKGELLSLCDELRLPNFCDHMSWFS